MDANSIQANLANRRALLATSERFSKKLGTFSGTTGGTLRVKLDNVGILTGVMLRVYGTLDIGTADGTLSDAAPYNMLRRVKLQDYDGSDRINLSGHHLWLINSIRQRKPYSYNNVGTTAVDTIPLIPTAQVDDGAFEFFVYLPLALNPDSDLRGSILAQTAVGEMYVSVDIASASELHEDGNEDAVYDGAATTTVDDLAINVDVYQDYLVARDLGNGQLPLPVIDLLTVYELRGGIRSSDNLAASSDKDIDIPNVRTVLGCVMTYLNNGAYSNTDLERLALVVNSNNTIWERERAAQVVQQRNWIGGDLGKSAWFLNWRDKPLQTDQVGNLKIKFRPAAYTSSANTWVERTFESLYAKGTPLPGLAQ